MNYMMIDCETTNSLDDPLVYDVGYEVFDEAGRTIEKASMTNKDIFLDKEFMSIKFLTIGWKFGLKSVNCFLGSALNGVSMMLVSAMIA